MFNKTTLFLIKESFNFAYNAIKTNKLRTFLSLLGVTIGILAIISIYTVIDSLEKSVKNSISSLGSDVVFVQKWPWSFESNYPWWKYMNRPEPTIKELEFINKNCKTISNCAYLGGFFGTLSYDNVVLENVSTVFISNDYTKIFPININEGRYFSNSEFNHSCNYVVVGHNIAESIFGDNINPIGKQIKINGRKTLIIGTILEEGENILQLGNSPDDQVYITLNYAKNFVDIEGDQTNQSIAIKGIDKNSNQKMIDEVRKVLRHYRKINPIKEDSFSINETKLLISGFEGVFSSISVAGFIIGLASLLIGGFGIANIMYVSVSERTTIIGIQKALGAKNSFILYQFLFEAVFLCLLGGIIGLFLVYIATLIVSIGFDFNISLTLENIFLGLGFSIIIGIISGVFPALKASQKHPVDAIRHSQN